MSSSAADRVVAPTSRRRLCLLWLLIEGLFGAYGFLAKGEPYRGAGLDLAYSLEGAGFRAALGVGPATCLLAGRFAWGQVKRGRWRKRPAAFGMLAMPASCAVLTLLALITVQGIFQSEEPGFALVFLPRWSLIGSAAVAAAMIVVIVGCDVEPADGEQRDIDRPPK